MKRYNTCPTPASYPVTIEGTSMTIPGLAPDLQTLLAAAEAGEPLPRVGVPVYDETPEAGIVRAGVAELTPEELLLAHQSAEALPPQPVEKPAGPASPDDEEGGSVATE